MKTVEALNARHYLVIGLAVIGGLMLWPGMLNNLLRVQGYEPHGHCCLWDRNLTFLMVTADTLIGLSYFGITTMLGLLVYRTRGKMPFHWVFIAFGVFIITCGLTHFTDVLNIWIPAYWTTGYIRLLTMVASVITALALPWSFPRIYAMIDRANLADQRLGDLEAARVKLETEVSERRQAEERLIDVNIRLEKTVTELEEANKEVQRFAYIMSHDFRAPLINLRGFSDILLKSVSTLEIIFRESLDTLDETKRQAVENALNERIPMATRFIQSSVDRMDQYTSALLELSRIGRKTLNPQTVQVHTFDIVDKVLADPLASIVLRLVVEGRQSD